MLQSSTVFFFFKGVSFISEPVNQTITEGTSVHFACTYEGSNRLPLWRINTTIFSHTQLPSGFKFDREDFSLCVLNAPASLNFTSFQCVVGTRFSNRGYLIVEKNSTVCKDCMSSTRNFSQRQQHLTTVPPKLKTGVFIYLAISITQIRSR